MAKLKNVLRYYVAGMGIKEISSAFYLSRNTVRKYVRAFQESGLSLEKVLGMSDEHLYGMFIGGKSRTGEPSERRAEQGALLPEYADRLRQKGVTVRKLFEEYRQGIRRVTVTRISASCCGGTCFRQKPLDIATRCTSTLRVTGLR